MRNPSARRARAKYARHAVGVVGRNVHRLEIASKRITLAPDFKMSIIKLQSSDGEIFEVEIEIAKASNTIKNMIEGELLRDFWLHMMYKEHIVYLCWGGFTMS